MELLTRRLRPFLICLVLAATGCEALRHANAGGIVPFSHEKMLHQSLVCADCHTKTAEGAQAGMPDLETCLMCHEDLDKGKPANRTASVHFVDGQYKGAKVTDIPSEVIFSHKAHTVDAKVGCVDCHKGIESNVEVDKNLGLEMKDCIACHAKSPSPRAAIAQDDCERCHSEIRKDAMPPSHKAHWLKRHGDKAQDGDKTAANDCSLCHTDESCNTCHKTQAPENHNNNWRMRGHGTVAAMDREGCATCHTSESCTACHSTTAPRTHRGQWGGEKSRHCQSCHIPVAGESCALCHQGTPSHNQATPVPAGNHPPSNANCRSCHGVAPTAPLPHSDNGSSCTYCHR
jgi:hypothetical protein